jgi:PRTRC genetic system ThiF family protein
MKVFAYEGAWHLDHIVIVGVGGTGSALARLTARMLWQRKEAGQTVPSLILIDPDTVEARNVNRQAFSVAEIGSFKSQSIALRYSLAYGLSIEYATEPFDHTKHLPSGSILVDCTDNHLARREIVKGIEEKGVQGLSMGNAYSHGQIILGSCGDEDKLADTISHMESDTSQLRLRDGIFHPVYHLPHFGLIYPELLEPEPPVSEPEPDTSCAIRVLEGSQHPLVNENVAMIAAGYLFKLLHRQPITSFMTTIDVHNFRTEVKNIDPIELRAVLSRNKAEPASEQPAV